MYLRRSISHTTLPFFIFLNILISSYLSFSIYAMETTTSPMSITQKSVKVR